jgi:3'-phosphoadenosine 5'-phosphosulfate sulfotransferase (PAPS reductase)/FAD synthetase
MKMICWWSGGITSAVACKLTIDKYGAIPVFIETGAHHEDTLRFKKDCENWYNVPILTIQTPLFKDHFDVIEKFRYVNGPAGARCTSALKRKVREDWEKQQNITHYVWGFEKGAKEEARAERIKITSPTYQHVFPLIENNLSKQDCVDIVIKTGIEIPMMYKLGFNNNNCIGCVKGGKAYWNMIRIHFPDNFNKMATLERLIGRSCIRGTFLDELDPSAGRGTPPIVTECGATGEGCTTEESRDYYKNEEIS